MLIGILGESPCRRNDATAVLIVVNKLTAPDKIEASQHHTTVVEILLALLDRLERLSAGEREQRLSHTVLATGYGALRAIKRDLGQSRVDACIHARSRHSVNLLGDFSEDGEGQI